jgi:hypothetical protein
MAEPEYRIIATIKITLKQEGLRIGPLQEWINETLFDYPEGSIQFQIDPEDHGEEAQ